MTWLDVRVKSGGREALARCAADLLGAVAVARVTSTEDALTCRLEVRGEGIDEAIARVRAALDERVAIAAAPASGRSAENGWDPNERVAGEAGAENGWDPNERVAGEAGAENGWDPNEWLRGPSIEAIEHTADEAFAVTARDRADLLAAAAEALGGLIVLPGRVRPILSRDVLVAAPEPSWADDDRLFAWLAEVLYTLDAGRFALRRAVILEDDERGVRGRLFGEPIDEGRHEVCGGIKAVTYHGLTIEEAQRIPPGGGPEETALRATVVIDV